MEQYYALVGGTVSMFQSQPMRAGADKRGQKGSYSGRKLLKVIEMDRNLFTLL